MKKILLCLIILMLVSACGCAEVAEEDTQSYQNGYEAGYNDGYDDAEYKGYDEGYEDGRESGYEELSSEFYDVDTPCFASICDEINSQGHAEYYEYFLRLADDLDYTRSSLLGDYCLDVSDNIVYDTDSDCISLIKYTNMRFLHIDSFDDLMDEIDDNDETLKDCKPCEKCFG